MKQEIYDALPEYDDEPEWIFKNNAPDYTFGEYKWACTCGSFPEQYEVFYKEKQVAYIRLRGGILSASVPDCIDGQQIIRFAFEKHNKGCFDDDTEREKYITYIQRALEFYYE